MGIVALHTCRVAGLHQIPVMMVPDTAYKQPSSSDVASQAAGHGPHPPNAMHTGANLLGANRKAVLLEREEVVSVADSIAAQTRSLPQDHHRAASMPSKDDSPFSVADSVAFRPRSSSFVHADSVNMGWKSPRTKQKQQGSNNKTMPEKVERMLEARVRAVINEMGNVEEAQEEHRNELAEVRDVSDAAADLVIANVSYQHAASKMPHLLERLKKHDQTLTNVSATLEAAETLGLKASSDLRTALEEEEVLHKRYRQLAGLLHGDSSRTKPIMVVMIVFFAMCA